MKPELVLLGLFLKKGRGNNGWNWKACVIWCFFDFFITVESRSKRLYWFRLASAKK